MSKGRPVANKYKVPERQWNKWTREAQKVFNLMMQSLRPAMQWAFLHPNAKLMTREHWQTIRWNVAWVAAAAITEGTYLGKVKNVGTKRR